MASGETHCLKCFIGALVAGYGKAWGSGQPPRLESPRSPAVMAHQVYILLPAQISLCEVFALLVQRIPVFFPTDLLALSPKDLFLGRASHPPLLSEHSHCYFGGSLPPRRLELFIKYRQFSLFLISLV